MPCVKTRTNMSSEHSYCLGLAVLGLERRCEKEEDGKWSALWSHEEAVWGLMAERGARRNFVHVRPCAVLPDI